MIQEIQKKTGDEKIKCVSNGFYTFFRGVGVAKKTAVRGFIELKKHVPR